MSDDSERRGGRRRGGTNITTKGVTITAPAKPVKKSTASAPTSVEDSKRGRGRPKGSMKKKRGKIGSGSWSKKKKPKAKSPDAAGSGRGRGRPKKGTNADSNAVASDTPVAPVENNEDVADKS